MKSILILWDKHWVAKCFSCGVDRRSSSPLGTEAAFQMSHLQTREQKSSGPGLKHVASVSWLADLQHIRDWSELKASFGWFHPFIVHLVALNRTFFFITDVSSTTKVKACFYTHLKVF